MFQKKEKTTTDRTVAELGEIPELLKSRKEFQERRCGQ